jgi:hypothetical protein
MPNTQAMTPTALAASPEPTVVLRLARREDAATLARLAALDSAPPLREPALLALVDGRALAALSLADRRVVADPFAPTADMVDLLRKRASSVEPRLQRRRRVLSPRFAA